MNLEEVTKIYTDTYYVEDSGALPLVLAATLSGRLPGDAIWVFLVGPSSGGKTELINAIAGGGWVHQISTLTANTFLSGMRNNDKETSLLKRIGNGVITMKDFTTILSMPKDLQQMIFAQLREIYDGYMVKETGTGDRIEWRGKMNLIAGVTEKIHAMEAKFSGMGTRALQYTLPEQDRMKTARRAQENSDRMTVLRAQMRDACTEFMDTTLLRQDEYGGKLDAGFKEEMLVLADFSARARSPVERDIRGEMQLVLSAEMPMRMSNQLYMLAEIFQWMNGNEMNDELADVIRKTAMDSMPKQRRVMLRILAAHHSISTKAAALTLRYPSDTIRHWLEDCNALGLCERKYRSGNAGDVWEMKPEWRDIMVKYDKVKFDGKTVDVRGEAGSMEESMPGLDLTDMLSTAGGLETPSENDIISVSTPSDTIPFESSPSGLDTIDL